MRSQRGQGLNPGWGWRLLVVFWLVLGCAGRPPQTETQLVKEAEKALSKQDSLQKFMAAGFQSSLKDFSDYRVGPEDLLEVSVYGQEDLSRVVRVNAQGEINLPLIGVVPVAGKTPLEIEKVVAELYGTRYLRHPHVTVFVKEYRHQQVAVVGAVNKPGSYEMIGPRTLLEMLSQAGGLRDESGDVVHVIRHESAADLHRALKKGDNPKVGNPETIIIDLRQLLTKGELALNIPIQHGDVINVPFAGYAYVTGEVKKPGKIPVRKEITVTQAIALVEGLNFEAAGGDTRILRFDKEGQRRIIPVDLYALAKGEGQDVPLQENDIVVVPGSASKKVWSGLKSLFRGAIGVGYYIRP